MTLATVRFAPLRGVGSISRSAGAGVAAAGRARERVLRVLVEVWAGRLTNDALREEGVVHPAAAEARPTLVTARQAAARPAASQ